MISCHKTVELIKEEANLSSNCNINKLKNELENDDDRINNNLSKLIESIEIVSTETIKTNNNNNNNQFSKNVNNHQSINCVFDSSTKFSISTTSSNKHHHQQQSSQHSTNISIISKKNQDIDAQLITNRQEETNKTSSSKITCSSVMVAASATSTTSNPTNKLTATPVSNN